MSSLSLDGWPADLQALHRYMPWQARTRANGRIAKVPVAQRGRGWYPHDPLDPVRWLSWDAANLAVQAGAANGVGISLTEDLQLVALDIDACCTAEGTLNREVGEIMRRFPAAYAEHSPSGQGVHLLLRGQAPLASRPSGVEVITRGYLTVTGAILQPGDPDWDATATLAQWWRESGTGSADTQSGGAARLNPTLSDAHLIDRAHRARNGLLFAQLWNGDDVGYRSASEGDLALVLILLFWTGGDPVRADELFRQSSRFRPRWMLPVHDPYGQRTLRQAQALKAGRS